MLPAMTSTTDEQAPVTLPPVPTLISPAAAAHRLGCSRSTITRYVQRGHLLARRDPISGRVGIELPGIERIERSRVVISDAV
jgi:predicted site-specific integrase-resolvase